MSFSGSHPATLVLGDARKSPVRPKNSRNIFGDWKFSEIGFNGKNECGILISKNYQYFVPAAAG